MKRDKCTRISHCNIVYNNNKRNNQSISSSGWINILWAFTMTQWLLCYMCYMCCSSIRKVSPSSYIDSENVHKIFSERNEVFPVITIHIYVCMYLCTQIYVYSIYICIKCVQRMCHCVNSGFWKLRLQGSSFSLHCVNMCNDPMFLNSNPFCRNYYKTMFWRGQRVWDQEKVKGKKFTR